MTILESTSDLELLRAFVESGSSEAFAGLVGRHLAGVYGHARRVLRDGHRAEDVTQAVFFLLAQRAGRLDREVPLVGWLHQVTHFVCRNAQRVEARRRFHEQEAARMNPEMVSAGDVKVESQIDGILQQLPAHERDAVLLRYVHEYSVEEIARVTRVSEAAAKKRLHRGLQRLRERFAARGVALPAGFAPTMLLATGAPVHLFSAAVGSSVSPTAGVVQLAQGAKGMVLAAKIKVAAGILLAGVLLTGVGTVLFARSSRPTPVVAFVAAPPAAVPTAAAGVPVGDRVFTVKGVVLDPQNRPVANAVVTVPAPSNWNTRLTRAVVAQARSGADGRFEISYRRSQVAPFSAGGGMTGEGDWKSAMIVAHAEGFGIAWAYWDHTDGAGDVTLRLVADDVPIEGRILTVDGKPAANVPIVVQQANRWSNKEREELYDKDPHLGAETSLWLPRDAAGLNEPLFTDGDGRFRITGLGRDRYLVLIVHGLSVGFDRIDVATKNMARETRVVQQPRGDSDTFITYGAKFDFPAKPAVSVQGVVRDAATGKPMAGVKVRSYRFPGKFLLMDPEGLLATETDANGRYSLDGFPRGKGNEIVVVPGEDQPYFIRKMKVEEDGAESVATVDVELDKGVFVTGRVTDRGTGLPVCARMSYTTEKANEHTWDLPEFSRRDGAGMKEDESVFHETKADGSYRLVAAPGMAIISAKCWNDQYVLRVGAENVPIMAQRGYVLRLYQPCFLDLDNAITQIEVPENAGSVKADLQLEPGSSIEVSLVDPEGKGISNCVVRGDDAEGYTGWWGHRIAAARFAAVSLAPSVPRVIVALNAERKLGKVATFTLADIKDRALTMKLEPLATVTGRCVDAGGKPIGDLILEAAVGGKDLPEVTTDAGGRFTYTVVTGSDCYIRVSRGHYVGTDVVETFEPKAGEVRAVGDVVLAAPER